MQLYEICVPVGPENCEGNQQDVFFHFICKPSKDDLRSAIQNLLEVHRDSCDAAFSYTDLTKQLNKYIDEWNDSFHPINVIDNRP